MVDSMKVASTRLNQKEWNDLSRIVKEKKTTISGLLRGLIQSELNQGKLLSWLAAEPKTSRKISANKMK